MNKEKNIHVLDSLFNGFTFEDLLTAIQCNEKIIDKTTIKKVFNELLEENLRNAKALLNQNIDKILEVLSNEK
jgi:hypothetical protein